MLSILNRGADFGLPDSSHNLEDSQRQTDELIGSFAEQASDWKSLTSMMLGSFAYRLGNIAFLQATPRALLQTLPQLCKLAPVAGLTAEVTAFRASSLLLSEQKFSLSQLFNSKEWMSDAVNFGTLKGFGKLTHGQNPILSHFIQDSGMVMGHQLAFGLGIAVKPQGSLAEQFVHAEITNLQLAAGMDLMHLSTGGKLRGMEKVLELKAEALQINPSIIPPHLFPDSKIQPFFGTLAMATETTSPRTPYVTEVHRRVALLQDARVTETHQKLLHEWEHWPHSKKLKPEEKSTLEKLFLHYTRFALAHLGKEAPEQLPFIQEVYDMTLLARRMEDPSVIIPPEARSHLLHFLSSQPSRRSMGERIEKSESTASIPRISLEKTRAVLGETYNAWESHLRTKIEALNLSPLQKAQAYQRALALLHFYAQALSEKHSESLPTDFKDLKLDEEVAQKVLGASSQNPYPAASLEIFKQFFSETLKQGEVGAQLTIATHPTENTSEWESLSPTALDYLSPLPQETWAEYLTRSGLTRGQLSEADLGVAGATIFAWGSTFDEHTRIAPPGDVLHILGVDTYLNNRSEHGVDPFDAIKLKLPEQLASFVPDANHEVHVRYPKFMQGIDFAHFGLGSFFRAYLRDIPSGCDKDLAIQWEVSESTVSEFRRGVVRKMRMETLEKLAKNFSSSEAHQIEMFKFLIFLRYRPYFQAMLPIADQDGLALNFRPPTPSRVKLVLLPQEESLVIPDVTQRVRFEREPFASAINGSADLALELLERKIKEFEMTDQNNIFALEKTYTQKELQKKVSDLRDQHITYFELLSAQERNPGVVRPGELREMQEFYRTFFRLFEAIYLHALPEGSVRVGGTRIHYSLVPPTQDLKRGVMLERVDTLAPKALVVVDDLLEKGKALPLPLLRHMIHLRLAITYLRRQRILLAGDIYEISRPNRGEFHAEKNNPIFAPMGASFFRYKDSNRVIIQKFLVEQGIPEHETNDLIEQYKTIEKSCEDWSGSLLDPSENAILHRIIRGKAAIPAAERRKLEWEIDLEGFARAHQSIDIIPQLYWVFKTYLEAVPQPYRHFQEVILDRAIRKMAKEEGADIAARLKEPLLHFMRVLGLATSDVAASEVTVNVDGFSTASLATYIQRFQEIHPLRKTGPLVVDEILIDRVIDDRLADFPQLGKQKEIIAKNLKALIEEYNLRKPLLKVYEIADSVDVNRDPFQDSPLQKILEASLEDFKTSHAELPHPNLKLIHVSLQELRKKLLSLNLPNEGEIQVALAKAKDKLSQVGADTKGTFESDLIFLSKLCAHLHDSLKSLHRLESVVVPLVAHERYQSGLDQPEKIGEEVRKIFQAHTHSVFTEAPARSLHDCVSSKVSSRFEAYSKIREDVVRGMKTVYFQMLRSMKLRYDLIEVYMEEALQYAKDHKSKEIFLKDLLELTSELVPPLEQLTLETIEQHLMDLEVLLNLSQSLPSQKTSKRLHEIIEKVNRLDSEAKAQAATPLAPAPTDARAEERPAMPPLPDTVVRKAVIDPQAVLGGTLPADLVKNYQELLLVKDVQLIATLEASDTRSHLTTGEARPLVQLMALLTHYRSRLSESAQATCDEMILDIETSSDNFETTTQRVFNNYRSIQSELISKIRMVDYLGTFAEVRGNKATVTDREIYAALHHELTCRNLTADLQQIFDKEIRRVLESGKPFDDAYHIWLSEFYLKHREKIQATPSLKASENPRQLPLGTVKDDKLAKEYPELTLISEDQLKKYPGELALIFPELNKVLESGTRGADLLRIHAFMSRHTFSTEAANPLQKAWIEILTQFRMLALLSAHGGSQDHLLKRAHENILALYRKSHPQILAFLGETKGGEVIVGLLPEIIETSFDASKLWVPDQQATPTFVASNGVLPKALQILNRSPRNNRERNELEEILWDFIPAGEGASDAVVLESTTAMRDRILTYYLGHRPPALRFDIHSKDRPRESEAWSDYWEMGALLDEPLNNRRALLQKYFSQPHAAEPTQIAVIPQPSGEERQVIIKASMTQADLDRSKTMPTHTIRRIDLTAFQRMKMWLDVALENPYRKLLNLAGVAAKRGKPEADQKMEEELHRAASLLAMGLDPHWVGRMLKKRLFDIYRKHREEIHSTISFAGYAAQLTEVAQVPDYEVQRRIRKQDSNPIFASFLNSQHPTFVRIFSLVFQGEVPVHIRTKFSLEMAKVVHDTPESLLEEVARFYLKNREVIVRALRPWPISPPGELERVSKHSFLSRINDEDARDVSVAAGPGFVAPNDPQYLFIIKMVTLFEDGHISSILRSEFKKTWKAVRPQTKEAIEHAMVNFFIQYESDLERYLTKK